MSILASIMSKIFSTGATAAATAPASPQLTPGAAPESAGRPPLTNDLSQTRTQPVDQPVAQNDNPVTLGARPTETGGVDVAQVLDGLAAKAPQPRQWRRSIVDLMKLLDLDSSLEARQQLATELNYSGDMQESGAMNIWLHSQVMAKLAANGGKVPDDLKA